MGQEYGVTTGRRRTVNWLNISLLEKAVKISGSNIVVINKCDIIKELGQYNIIGEGDGHYYLNSMSSFEEMKNTIKERVLLAGAEKVVFSETKHGI